MRRIGCLLVALVASAALAPAASAGGGFTGHTVLTETRCTGGSVIISDGNALQGQQREALAWNVVGHQTTCEAFLVYP